jgi:hypothetical protein
MKRVKVSNLFSVFLAMVGLASVGLAVDYADLVTKGYRWVAVDGPYAYTSKEAARKFSLRASPKSELEHADEAVSYYLIPGMVVLVVENDTASGLSRIRAGGIAADLWTSTKYLSTHPIKNPYGTIETPENSGIISFSSPGPTPTSSANPAAFGSPAATITPSAPK